MCSSLETLYTLLQYWLVWSTELYNSAMPFVLSFPFSLNESLMIPFQCSVESLAPPVHTDQRQMLTYINRSTKESIRFYTHASNRKHQFGDLTTLHSLHSVILLNQVQEPQWYFHTVECVWFSPDVYLLWLSISPNRHYWALSSYFTIFCQLKHCFIFYPFQPGPR